MDAPPWVSKKPLASSKSADSSLKGSIPPWTRSDMVRPGASSSRPEDVKSTKGSRTREEQPPRSRLAKNARHSTPDDSRTSAASERGKRVKLGRTHGMLAVGAWAAREEIASLLEDGHPAEDIIQAIRSGEELGPSLRSEPGAETPQETPRACEVDGKPVTSSGSVKSERSSLSAEAPKWNQKAPNFSHSFRKKAEMPKVEARASEYSEYTPSDESMNEVHVEPPTTPFASPPKEELSALVSNFRKRAAAPKRVATPVDIRSGLARYVPKSLPRRANPSEQKKLDDYDGRTKAIYCGCRGEHGHHQLGL